MAWRRDALCCSARPDPTQRAVVWSSLGALDELPPPFGAATRIKGGFDLTGGLRDFVRQGPEVWTIYLNGPQVINENTYKSIFSPSLNTGYNPVWDDR